MKKYTEVLESYMIPITEGFLFKKKKKNLPINNNNKDIDLTIYLSFDVDMVIKETKVNLTPTYSFKNSEEKNNHILLDIKKWLSLILHTSEMMNAIKELCDKYNNTEVEERMKKFPFSYDEKIYPKMLTPQWFINQFKVYDVIDYVEITNEQSFSINYGIHIIEILIKMLNSKYPNENFNYGDGDEGCIYWDNMLK